MKLKFPHLWHRWRPTMVFKAKIDHYDNLGMHYLTNHMVIWVGYQCKGCKERRIARVARGVNSPRVDQEAYDWLNDADAITHLERCLGQ